MTVRGMRVSAAVKVVLTIVAPVALWQIVAVVFEPPVYLWPPVPAIAGQFVVNGSLLLHHATVTASTAAAGFGIAVLAGLLGAIVLHVAPPIRKAVWPLVVFSQVTPKVAIAPMLLIWFGYGVLPKLIISFLIAFFPILVTTLAGFESVPSEEEELARSMRVGRVGYLRRFELPSAAPYFFAGAKVAITLAVVGTVIGEFVGSNVGLGRLVLTANSQLNGPLMYATVLVLGALGLALYGLVLLAERFFVPWRVAGRLQS